MTLTYRCDNCGRSRIITTGIAGGEYSYSDHKGIHFHTLDPAFRQGGVVDVCGWCLQAVQEAVKTAKALERQTLAERIAGAMAHTRYAISAGIKIE